MTTSAALNLSSYDEFAAILLERAITPIQKQAALRGIADKVLVYEIP